MVEHNAVNVAAVGSSPTSTAINIRSQDLHNTRALDVYK